MKIRRDFVTNSSSSSFIIGNENEDISKDIVFRFIRDAYKEEIEIDKRLQKVADDYGLIREIYVSEFEGVPSIAYYRHNNKTKDTLELDDKIFEEFGIYLNDNIPLEGTVPWLECDTYAEYVQYWKNVREKAFKAYGNTDDLTKIPYAPFIIVDYSKDMEIENIHDRWNMIANTFKVADLEEKWDILGWYRGCTCSYFEHRLEDFEEYPNEYACSECKYGEYSPGCRKMRRNLGMGKLNADNIVVKELGKICVHSECGQIPEFVVEKLAGKSNEWCNHMG